MCRLCPQGQRLNQLEKNQHETGNSSQWNAPPYIPEDENPRDHSCENLKSYIAVWDGHAVA
jgi:hypothetical protein